LQSEALITLVQRCETISQANAHYLLDCQLSPAQVPPIIVQRIIGAPAQINTDYRQAFNNVIAKPAVRAA